MKDIKLLEQGPAGEETDGSLLEARVFRSQIRRHYRNCFGSPLTLPLEIQPNESGYSIAALFDVTNHDEAEAAAWIQENPPLFWDDRARGILEAC